MAWPLHDEGIIRDFASLIARERSWAIISCGPWREGASNAIWSLDTDAGAFVLKVGKHEGWRRLPIEAKVLSALGGDGAPLILAHGEAGSGFPWDWALLERKAGEHRTGLDPARAGALGRTIAVLREKARGISLEKGSWASFARNYIGGSLEGAKDGTPASLMARFESLLASLERFAAVGNLLDALPAGLVHGDLIPLNLIEGPDGSFSLIDWEQARLASAAWDLAGARRSFRMEPDSFAAMRAGLGESLPDEAIEFAAALYNLHVAAWRADTWYGRSERHFGDYFLIELEAELGNAEASIRSLS
jgi:aminoglycoside phosphotransferase (APT) family kinase protein